MTKLKITTEKKAENLGKEGVFIFLLIFISMIIFGLLEQLFG